MFFESIFHGSTQTTQSRDRFVSRIQNWGLRVLLGTAKGSHSDFVSDRSLFGIQPIRQTTPICTWASGAYVGKRMDSDVSPVESSKSNAVQFSKRWESAAAVTTNGPAFQATLMPADDPNPSRAPKLNDVFIHLPHA
jgi:hypothetical protein